MRKNKVFLSASTIALCLLLGYHLTSAQKKQSGWHASNLHASFSQGIAGKGGSVKADSGSSILEVSGKFRFHNATAPSVNIPKIYLKGWLTDAGLSANQRRELLAIGLKGRDGSRYYIFPHTIVRKFSTRLEDAAGNGIEFKKGEETEPAVVTLLKNPGELWLAFGVPSETTQSFTLCFDGVDYLISIATPK